MSATQRITSHSNSSTSLEEKEHLLEKNNDTNKLDLSTAPPSPEKPTSSGGNTGQSLFFFVILVGQSIGTQTYFKLSQRGGKYEYNTMSAMFIVELFKLCISLGQLMTANHGNIQACTAQFKVPKRIYLAYIFLALSYALYNQLIFFVMRLVDPGTFTLFKSLMPAFVAFLNFFAFGKTLTLSQVYCIFIQICGITPVTASTNVETGKVDFTYGVQSMIVLTATITFGAFNTVYNANVVKKEAGSYPLPVQNSILYAGGCCFNMLFYLFSMSPNDESFFFGYGNINVIVLLFLQSTVGVTISFVYKHGDAVLKTLSQPVVSAVLLFLSNILFDAPLDIIKISGAGSVIISTMLYLKLPPPEESNAKNTKSRFKAAFCCGV